MSLPAYDPALDHFARLGFEPRVQLERAELDSAYREASQRVHPDNFAAHGEEAQRRAQLASAALNEAYAVLKSELRRLEYLCQLGGRDLDSSDPQRGAPAMSPAFLMEMLERRDAIEAELESELQGRSESWLEEALDRLEKERGQTERERKASTQAARDALGRGEVPEGARALVRRRYQQRLLEELDQRVEAIENMLDGGSQDG